MAAVQTQNKVSLALPPLPPEVQREGVTVKKLSTAFLLGDRVYVDGRPLRLAVPEQLRGRSICWTRSPACPALATRGSRSPGLRHARVGQSGQDGHARLTATDVTTRFRRKTGRIRRARSASRRSPLGTDFQYPVNAAGRLSSRSSSATS